MAKGTNRGAWGLVVFLAVGVLGGDGLLLVRLWPQWVAKYRGVSADLQGVVPRDKDEGQSSSTRCQTTTRSVRPRLVIQTLTDREANIPLLFQERSFSAATLAVAVNHFVAIGENAAVKELIALAARWQVIDPNGRSINIHERIGWVCRVLFIPKGQMPLRPPMYGALWRLPYESMPLERWPLFPVVLSGSTYLVLSEGYALGGFPEPAKDYVAYCRKNGTFRRTLIKVPTRKQAMNDAAALRRSKAWKEIRWRNNSPKENETSRESQIGEYIQEQAEAIPTTFPDR